jgi:hypothetical protein
VSILGNVPSRKNFRSIALAVLGWYTMSLSYMKEDHDEAFMKTIICDIDGDSLALVKKLFDAFFCFAIGVILERLELLAKALDEPDPWFESWMRFASSCLFGRKFFVSGQGLMGLCPENYQKGDIIVILLGCAVPLLQRLYDEGDYELVGDVYLNGYTGRLRTGRFFGIFLPARNYRGRSIRIIFI